MIVFGKEYVYDDGLIKLSYKNHWIVMDSTYDEYKRPWVEDSEGSELITLPSVEEAILYIDVEEEVKKYT